MREKEYQWERVAASEEELVMAENGIAVIEIRGKKICLARHSGRWYGFAHACPHAGGIMAAGFLDAQGNVVCPVHRYRFNMASGRNISGEGFYLKTYPVDIREDGVFIGREVKRFPGWPW